MALLEAIGISKSFLFHKQWVKVLADLAFEISEGEFVSIIGSSGCGKSTLLELFAGITAPDSGSIILAGEEITGRSGLLGYMPQEDLLFPWLSTRQNALLPAKIKHHDLKQAKAKIEDLLPVFGLEKHADLLPYQLSGGLKQRVALLRTYMIGSRLLLLDEPFASLDALTRMQMQDWLQEIQSRLKLTIILVTHDIREALRLSDRIELMEKNPGRFVQSYKLEPEIKDQPSSMDSLLQEILSKF
ncbi:MAG TPA: ABC transporter ATP-binding protein [Candidatus Cloacimonadota bacterium]|nr:ABC transporter ATP-binding protein [Candidatus Cloacimonadota bacterium]